MSTRLGFLFSENSFHWTSTVNVHNEIREAGREVQLLLLLACVQHGSTHLGVAQTRVFGPFLQELKPPKYTMMRLVLKLSNLLIKHVFLTIHGKIRKLCFHHNKTWRRGILTIIIDSPKKIRGHKVFFVVKIEILFYGTFLKKHRIFIYALLKEDGFMVSYLSKPKLVNRQSNILTKHAFFNDSLKKRSKSSVSTI